MKKNVILIMADQMHKYALGAICPFVRTPNLEKLAQEGTLFLNAYSNNPVCGPFRGILYSGRYSKDNGVLDNGAHLSSDELCLPDELHDLGYETSFVGKLHLGADGNRPVPPEFWAGHQHFIGYQCYNGFWKDVCFYDEAGTEHRFDRHRTDVTADLGIERLRMLAETGKPFLHTIFFQAPHYPEQPSEEFEKLYDGVTIPLPEDYHEIDPYTSTWSPYSPRPIENCPDFQRYGNNIQKYLQLYYGMVSQIDANVGRILDEVERLGIADNTVILFSADHGDMQGSHGLKNKCLPHERSCGIPLIIKIPGMKQEKVVMAPVSSVDYYPTIMELAGGKSRKKLPGHSLLPLIQGKTRKSSPVFAEFHLSGHTDGWYMIRDSRYKLVVDYHTKKPSMLFDLRKDPDEYENLADRPEYRQELSRLLQIMAPIVAPDKVSL